MAADTDDTRTPAPDGDTGSGRQAHDVGTASATSSNTLAQPLVHLNPMVHLPRWVPRLILIIIFSIFATLAAFWFVQRIRTLLMMLVISLFLSFAMEPAVNWLASHGWRRGPATALAFLVLLVIIFAVIGSMVPLVIDQVQDLIDRVPDWLDRLNVYTIRWFDFDISTEHLVDQIDNLGAAVGKYGGNLAGNVLGFGAAVLTAVFEGLGIGLFTFYLVADGPRVRRTVCSLMRPERQADVLRAWDIAIDKTGGYLYSRLLLAAISAFISYFVLLGLGVPFPIPLALWLGLTSQFIPTVGAYVGAVLPLLVAVLYDPFSALVFLIYVFVYQQLENYLLSPRVTARTMELHPAVAFGSVIAGASVLGAVGAFLALPAAAIIQAGVSNYITTHEVVDTELTRDRSREETSEEAPSDEEAPAGGRRRGFLGGRLGRRKPPQEPPESAAEDDT